MARLDSEGGGEDALGGGDEGDGGEEEGVDGAGGELCGPVGAEVEEFGGWGGGHCALVGLWSRFSEDCALSWGLKLRFLVMLGGV